MHITFNVNKTNRNRKRLIVNEVKNEENNPQKNEIAI
jgi:hypothetical protein